MPRPMTWRSSYWQGVALCIGVGMIAPPGAGSRGESVRDTYWFKRDIHENRARNYGGCGGGVGGCVPGGGRAAEERDRAILFRRDGEAGAGLFPVRERRVDQEEPDSAG